MTTAPTTPKLIGIILLGAAACTVAAICRAYDGPIHDSIKPGHGRVDYWTWQWMNRWYANTEDGNGLYAVMSDCVTTYRSTFPRGTPDWVIVACWSGFRNNANNYKRAFRDDSWLPPGAPSVWPLS